jgi:hypothetical protein
MSIENIVLSRDHRGISALRPYLAPDFCERAATFILERLGNVLIATGFYIPAGSAPETDGPPGAIALGQALAGLGSRVAYITDAYTSPLLQALLGPDGQILEFPFADHQESWLHAADLVRSLAPTVMISVERCGLTDEGVYRNMRGIDVSGYHAKIDYLFRTHEASVGIGDGGNEIGMGNLAAAIPMVVPMAGRPSATTTTRLVIASVSNWGAWGIIAAMSRLRGRNLLPSVHEAHDLTARAVALGAVDGTTGRRTESVDGFPLEENDRVLAEMHTWLGRYGIGQDRA